MHGDLDRRDFIASFVGGATAAFVATHWPEIQAASALAAQAAPNAPYRVLSAAQVRDLDAFTATLVPTDDTPGAREAHVVRFIDNALATFMKDRRGEFDKAMRQLVTAVARRSRDTRSFAALDEADRIAVVTDLEKKNAQTFGILRGATMLGMFTDPVHGGNAGKVGWKLIGFDDRHSWAAPFGYYDRG